MSREKDARIAAARAAADAAGHQRQDGTADDAIRVMHDVQKAQADLSRELTTYDPQHPNG